MAELQRLPRISRLRTPTRKPKGSHLVQAARATVHVGGPGQPPPGFVIGQTSASEWIVYWALAKIFRNPVDPRQPPFYGGAPDWSYQVPFLGSYTRAPGSAVADFVIYLGREIVIIRLQTQRFHVLTTSQKQASDMLQRASLERFARVADLYETDVLGDPTGEKAIVAVKRALQLIEPFNPVYAGVPTKRTG